MRGHLEAAISKVVAELFKVKLRIDLTRPEEKFGDYATNVAFILATRLHQSPAVVAEKIAEKLRTELKNEVEEATIVGGFINLRLSDIAIVGAANQAAGYRPSSYKGKSVVAEYSDPNPFKVLHAGHFYTSVVGDSIANLVELAGAKVYRVNFGGDVGLHVAKTIWAILNYDGDNNPKTVLSVIKSYESKNLSERINWLSQRYVDGTRDYDDDKQATKQEVAKLNQQIYELHATDDRNSDLSKIYWTCRSWSYAYFEAFYREIGIHSFEKYYPESLTAPVGLKTVREQLVKGVYEESDGAIVFRGDKYGLHTRVFISAAGLPTYEAKEVGLSMLKWQDYQFDQSIIITGNDIVEYMKVVLKSLEQFKPELAEATIHLTHGMIKLKGGRKMSSRKGNILTAAEVLEATEDTSKKLNHSSERTTSLAAIKYAFLKQRLGGDIIYDPNESLSLAGNSGPYLQYAHARARSILKSVDGKTMIINDTRLESAERSLARKLGEYPEAINQAVETLMPHYVCTYLHELAQLFNKFYENNQVIGDKRQSTRLSLVEAYADTLKQGLSVMNISAPDHM